MRADRTRVFCNGGQHPVAISEPVDAIDAEGWRQIAYTRNGTYAWTSAASERIDGGYENEPLRGPLAPIVFDDSTSEHCVVRGDDLQCTARGPSPRGGRYIEQARVRRGFGRATQLVSGVATCALVDGRVSCWHALAEPHALDIPRATSIAVYDHEACAIAIGGALYCWTYGRT